MQSLYLYIYILSCLVRVAALPVLLYSPLGGWILMFIVDTIDYGFALRAGMTWKRYQTIDKLLDILNRIYLVISAYILGWPSINVVAVLFLLRSIGDVLYFRTRSDRYFFLFPNIIEYFYPAYLLTDNTIMALLIATPLKLWHEYAIHIQHWVDPRSKIYLKQHPRQKQKRT